MSFLYIIYIIFMPLLYLFIYIFILHTNVYTSYVLLFHVLLLLPPPVYLHISTLLYICILLLHVKYWPTIVCCICYFTFYFIVAFYLHIYIVIYYYYIFYCSHSILHHVLHAISFCMLLPVIITVPFIAFVLFCIRWHYMIHYFHSHLIHALHYCDSYSSIHSLMIYCSIHHILPPHLYLYSHFTFFLIVYLCLCPYSCLLLCCIIILLILGVFAYSHL